MSPKKRVFSLHYVFLSHINRALKEFQLRCNHHSVSTKGNQTPHQIWIAGVMSDDYQGCTAVQDIRNPIYMSMVSTSTVRIQVSLLLSSMQLPAE